MSDAARHPMTPEEARDLALVVAAQQQARARMEEIAAKAGKLRGLGAVRLAFDLDSCEWEIRG